MKVKSLRGVEDIIPPKSEKFEKIIDTFVHTVKLYGFKSVILPIFEDINLFIRSVGETTDIVQKEMYTFKDKGDRELALRPEGTASAVRAYIEHGIYAKEPFTKWFYIGPMFRYERPQTGRNRQFFQAGCEIFGISSPGSDSELIEMAFRILKNLKIDSSLEINSIGCKNCRPTYRKKLTEYLSSEEKQLCKNCRERLYKNPLRVLDCKNETCKSVVKNAPKITQFLCEECDSHFKTLKNLLNKLEIPFIENSSLVRGLDYYTKTVFEFKSDKLGAQSTVLAGGRYDNLIKNMGGSETPALGFAIGIDRVILLSEDKNRERKGVLIVTRSKKAYEEGIKLSKFLRNKGIYTEIDHRQGSFKSQFKLADKLNMKYAVIIGDEELESGFYSLKSLETGKQEKINSTDELITRI